LKNQTPYSTIYRFDRLLHLISVSAVSIEEKKWSRDEFRTHTLWIHNSAVGYLFSTLKFTIHCKDEDSLSELHVNIREETQDFGTGDLTDLFTEFVAALRDQVLPQPFHHLDALGGFRQLPFCRRQNAFEPDNHEIPRH
jgi:hypothetical protein